MDDVACTIVHLAAFGIALSDLNIFQALFCPTHPSIQLISSQSNWQGKQDSGYWLFVLCQIVSYRWKANLELLFFVRYRKMQWNSVATWIIVSLHHSRPVRPENSPDCAVWDVRRTGISSSKKCWILKSGQSLLASSKEAMKPRVHSSQLVSGVRGSTSSLQTSSDESPQNKP